MPNRLTIKKFPYPCYKITALPPNPTQLNQLTTKSNINPTNDFQNAIT